MTDPTPNYFNADVPDKSQLCHIHTRTEDYIRNLYKKLKINKRMECKLINVAQTIADLNESTRISQKHINLAVELMGLNNPYFENFG